MEFSHQQKAVHGDESKQQWEKGTAEQLLGVEATESMASGN